MAAVHLWAMVQLAMKTEHASLAHAALVVSFVLKECLMNALKVAGRIWAMAVSVMKTEAATTLAHVVLILALATSSYSINASKAMVFTWAMALSAMKTAAVTTLELAVMRTAVASHCLKRPALIGAVYMLETVQYVQGMDPVQVRTLVEHAA